ncbi:hypothetical protein Bca4012_062052 [Brassica carinata]
MDSKETHQQQQNRNAAALSGPISTSQDMHACLSVRALSLRQPQPQPQQPFMLNASPYSVATQQPWMQLGTEQLARGRLRKYAPPDGADASSSSGSGPPAKRGRGLPPPGSGNRRRRNALGGEGEDESITAQIINVNAGEDIARKLVEFMNQEPREGLYYITDMSGTFLNTESDDGATVTRTGKLSVSLTSPVAKSVGGCVGGMLVAGSQVQVLVGIIGPEEVKLSAASAPANVFSSSGGGGGPGFPQSQGPQRSSESAEENASKSPLLHQVGNSTPQPPHRRHLWPGNNPQ